MNREKITHVISDMTENKYKKNTGNKRWERNICL